MANDESEGTNTDIIESLRRPNPNPPHQPWGQEGPGGTMEIPTFPAVSPSNNFYLWPNTQGRDRDAQVGIPHVADELRAILPRLARHTFYKDNWCDEPNIEVHIAIRTDELGQQWVAMQVPLGLKD
jgi:hypothetical protein